MKTIKKVNVQPDVSTHGDVREDINLAIGDINANFEETRTVVENGLLKTEQHLTPDEQEQAARNLGINDTLITARIYEPYYIWNFVNYPDLGGSIDHGIIHVVYNVATGKFCAGYLNPVSHTYSYYAEAPNFHPDLEVGEWGTKYDPRPGEYPKVGKIYVHNDKVYIGTAQGLTEVKYKPVVPDVDFAVQPNRYPKDANIYSDISDPTSYRGTAASACRIKVNHVYLEGSVVDGLGTVVDDGVVLFIKKRISGHYKKGETPTNRNRGIKKYSEYGRIFGHEEYNILSFNHGIQISDNQWAIFPIHTVVRLMETQLVGKMPGKMHPEKFQLFTPISGQKYTQWGQGRYPENIYKEGYGSMKVALARKIAYRDADGHSKAIYSPKVYGRLSLQVGSYSSTGTIKNEGVYLVFNKDH